MFKELDNIKKKLDEKGIEKVKKHHEKTINEIKKLDKNNKNMKKFENILNSTCTEFNTLKHNLLDHT